MNQAELDNWLESLDPEQRHQIAERIEDALKKRLRQYVGQRLTEERRNAMLSEVEAEIWKQFAETTEIGTAMIEPHGKLIQLIEVVREDARQKPGADALPENDAHMLSGKLRGLAEAISVIREEARASENAPAEVFLKAYTKAVLGEYEKMMVDSARAEYIDSGDVIELMRKMAESLGCDIEALEARVAKVRAIMDPR